MPVIETIIIALSGTVAAIVIANKVERRTQFNRLYEPFFMH